MKEAVELNIAYRLINHGPVVLVSSVFRKRADVTPIAWVMPACDEPPRIALAVWKGHFIYKCIMKTKDFVVNIPGKNMMRQVVQCGQASGKSINKFRKFSLKKERSKTVRSPRLAGSLAFLECTLVSDKKLAQKYGIIIGEVKYAEAEKKAFDKRWLLKKGKYKTLHHLGENVFCVPAGKILK